LHRGGDGRCEQPLRRMCRLAASPHLASADAHGRHARRWGGCARASIQLRARACAVLAALNAACSARGAQERAESCCAAARFACCHLRVLLLLLLCLTGCDGPLVRIPVATSTARRRGRRARTPAAARPTSCHSGRRGGPCPGHAFYGRGWGFGLAAAAIVSRSGRGGGVSAVGIARCRRDGWSPSVRSPSVCHALRALARSNRLCARAGCTAIALSAGRRQCGATRPLLARVCLRCCRCRDPIRREGVNSRAAVGSCHGGRAWLLNSQVRGSGSRVRPVRAAGVCGSVSECWICGSGTPAIPWRLPPTAVTARCRAAVAV
jgi:hypothetical protein